MKMYQTLQRMTTGLFWCSCQFSERSKLFKLPLNKNVWSYRSVAISAKPEARKITGIRDSQLKQFTETSTERSSPDTRTLDNVATAFSSVILFSFCNLQGRKLNWAVTYQPIVQPSIGWTVPELRFVGNRSQFGFTPSQWSYHSPIMLLDHCV